VIRAHAAAGLTLLASADAELPAFDGEVAGSPPIYVVTYLTTPQGVGARLSADVPKARFLLTTICVGRTPNECRWAVEKVHNKLVGSRLTVTGRVCDPFQPPDQPAQVRRDDSLEPPAWIATDVWPFTSSQAE
jgi:hypothetical protein